MPSRAVSTLRARARATFFDTLRKAFATDDGKRILADSLDGLTSRSTIPPLQTVPYNEFRRIPRSGSSRQSPIFITARFRTGSTLLWNIFRHVRGCQAFYEPLNERRWFDASARGNRVDRSHGVDEYWREYEGLDHLGRWYREDWTSRALYMSEDASDPGLVSYLEGLIDAARSRAVLQFNRVDFRLPWLRRHFPDAIVVHLYRHPRDQWVSTLWGHDFPRDGSIKDFAKQDAFYLLAWARDLSYHFPILDPRAAEHPYELFYCIWRLSYAFGREYSHASVSFERLCEAPHDELRRLFAVTQLTGTDVDALVPLVSKPSTGRWREYADDDWFSAIESRCDERLERAAGLVHAVSSSAHATLRSEVA